MSSLEATGPNAEQIKYWNETAGPKWVGHQEFIDGQIRPLGLLAMDRAALQPGERVLDVGCGCGGTTLEIGRRVTASGSVTGADLSAVMLDRARQDAAAARMPHVGFVQADVQTHGFPPASVDAVFSRFGVMFFADPVAAFANLRSALRPGGRAGFVCWRGLQDNPWMLVPLMAAAQHITLPAPPAPDAPGPMSFASPDRVRRILSDAGLADIELDEVNETLSIGAGADLDGIVDLVFQMGPTGQLVREAAADKLVEVARSVRAALEPYYTPQGVRLGSGAWIVSARRP